MNLSLNNTQNAFAYKSNTDLNKAKWLFTVIQNPWIVSLGTRFTPMLMKSGLPINGLIRSTIFNQFVGGETLEESARVTKMLGSYGVQVILDYGVEAKEGDASFDEVTEQFIAAVEFGPKIKAYSLLAGGQSGNSTSPHFFDQGKMYSDGQFKEVYFYKSDVLKHAVSSYHP